MAAIRTAKLTLLYEGKDISEDVSACLLSAEFTDAASGQADDLQITLVDRDRLWSGAWFPDKGAKITASLSCENWRKPGETLSMKMGTFEIDEIETSGPPSVVTLKAVSALVTTAFRGEKKSRGWENISFEAVAREIATTHGFELYYEADAAIELQRVDQNAKSDGEFLEDFCKEHGLTMAVKDEKLIIFEQKTYDARAAMMTVTRTGGEVLSFRFSSKSHEIYKACRVDYHDSATNEDMSYTFSPEDAPVTGSVLKVNERADSLATAQAKATSSLRAKNKDQFTGDLTLFGNPNVRGGVNIALSGFGSVFDGTWHVEEAKHSIGSGYGTSATIRKVVSY